MIFPRTNLNLREVVLEYQFHFEVFDTYWIWIAKGLGMTLYISIVAMFFALIIGLIVALIRLSKIKPVALLDEAATRQKKN